MSTRKRTGHYVVSTHWDREWYQSFQDYRFRLVAMLDEVLDTMERDPGFRYFQMDGQSIPIEDYLEVRPEREEQIRAMARAGRLRLGPWYVLPDEFLVSGESLVRNLQAGLAVASKYGQPSRVGFICDLFGHISQLPQILRGFGIDSAFLWRGANEPTHGAIWRWQSPDGSEVLAYRFSPIGGYCTYAFKVRKGAIPDEPLELESALDGLRELVEHETQRCPTPSFLLFDGGDHMEIEPLTSEILKRGGKAIPGVELIHSHLDGFVEDLREQRDTISRVVSGELRDPGMMGEEGWLIPGVLSSRIHLKQANARCENELCLWAEPFSTFAAALGAEYPQGYLAVAWRHLLQNHPHDSICGCSIDAVHKDMEYRFDQCHAVASRLSQRAMRAIADRVQLPDLEEKDQVLFVFNASSEPVRGLVDLTVRFPTDTETFQEFFGFEKKAAFRLLDAHGTEVPYQLVAQRWDRLGFHRVPRKFPIPDPHHEVDITAALEIPAYGYTTLTVRSVKGPTRYLGSMHVDDHTIENDSLRVKVAPNGTITLTDKGAGQDYPGLLTLEDRADIGDGWYHGIAVNDAIQSSAVCSADVALVADGINKATLRIRVTMDVPEEFVFDRMVRSDVRKPFIVTHDVTLRRGGDCVEVQTTVENTIRDHRLRVLLPSGVRAATYLSDSAFDVVERPIALRPDNAQYKELEVETRPQRTWTAVHDTQRGLALVANGLPESAVLDRPDRAIALTLLRAFRRAVFTNGNEGGQIQGRHVFDYRIVPLQGPPDVVGLSRAGQKLSAAPRAVQLAHRDLVLPGPKRELPRTHSFLGVESSGVVVTAIHRRPETDAVTLRMYNPTAEQANVTVRFEGTGKNAHLTDLEGRPGDPVPIRKGVAELIVKPRQIVTIAFA